MFSRLGRFVVKRRWWVIVTTVVMLGAGGVIGAGVIDRLSQGGFEDEGSEAQRAIRALEDDFGVRDPNLILLVGAKEGSVDDPAVARESIALTEELASEPGVTDVVSYWSTGDDSLKSTDGREALVVGLIEGNEEVALERTEDISARYNRSGESIDVSVGGFQEVFRTISTEVEEDLARAESIALPITMLLLVLVFGSVVAASLPLAIGVFAIVGSFFALTVITEFTEVSIFALNLVTMLGLGLGIDYSLFMVSRYREELRNGRSPAEAVLVTVETAGRTVAFSGITVALSLAALMLFPLSFLRSFAYAGIAVVLLAAFAATVFLPAVLAALGRRVDALSWRRKKTQRDESDGIWHRIATIVMRRPLPIATGVVALLLVLGTPFLSVAWGTTDQRVLPADDEVRLTSDHIANDFSVNNTQSLSIVARDVQPGPEIETYAKEVSMLDDVAAVTTTTGTYADGNLVAPPDRANARFGGEKNAWLSVAVEGNRDIEDAQVVVEEIRDLSPPFETMVTGPAATQLDARDSLFSRLPLAALWIGGATFALLFLMFGSVLVPFKAIVLNLLSLTATFGAVVWIFQEGNLSGLLEFTPLGAIEVSVPVLMFCIAFGLSMDYEVFLLSRIKEEHDRTGDNVASVALGLERTGRIVTAAAALLSIVFVAFGTSGVSFIKMFGIGLTIAVLVDATLVRATLVPAFMRLAGEANWWAPGWMRRFYRRYGVSESAPAPALERT